jgi:hypothetical protein
MGGEANPTAKKQPEIVVIPEKFYGVALHLNNKTEAESATPPAVAAPVKPSLPPVAKAVHPSSWRDHLPFALVAVGLVLVVGGGFVYLNRDLLFGGKPSATPVQTIVVSAPAQPMSLTATSSAPRSASLAWIDAASNEDGYRVERGEVGRPFVVLTNLPANSEAFLDVTAQPSQTYAFRVIAVNAGGESAPSNEAMVLVSAAPDVILQPTSTTPNLPPGGLDSDSDGLTDAEEPLYRTDIHHPDTDQDGFLDGNEVFHLYNPSAQAPVRLIDSGLVKAVTSTIGWTVDLPLSWQASLEGADGSRASFSFDRPETFRLSVEGNSQKASLQDWYLTKYPNVSANDIRPFATKQGIEGILGADRLEAFFPWEDSVLVVRYDLAGQPFVNFRSTFEMILNSLTLAATPTPSAPSTASTSTTP